MSVRTDLPCIPRPEQQDASHILQLLHQCGWNNFEDWLFTTKTQDSDLVFPELLQLLDALLHLPVAFPLNLVHREFEFPGVDPGARVQLRHEVLRVRVVQRRVAAEDLHAPYLLRLEVQKTGLSSVQKRTAKRRLDHHQFPLFVKWNSLSGRGRAQRSPVATRLRGVPCLEGSVKSAQQT